MVDAELPKLPWRPELEIYDTYFIPNHADSSAAVQIDVKAYAGKLTADNGYITQCGLSVRDVDVDWLAAGLECAACYYFFGRDLEKAEKGGKNFIKQLRSEGQNEMAEFIKKAPPHRPASYSLKAFIWVMADIWEAIGGLAGTAYDGFGGGKHGEYWEEAGDAVSRFQRFAGDWLDEILATRSLKGLEGSLLGVGATDHPHRNKNPLTRKRIRNFMDVRRAVKSLPRPKRGRPVPKSST